MRRIFYLTCFLIAYGSLYPFHFVTRDSPFGVLAVFASSLDVRLSRAELHDLIVNLIIYIPVGFFYVLDERHHYPAWRRCLHATLAGALLSLCMETTQYWFEPRTPSLIDLLTNTISAAAGGILGVAFARRARQSFDTLSETVLGHPSSALFLGIVWAAALLSPGDWGRTGAVDQIRAAFTTPHLAPGHILVNFSQWLGIGALAAAVIGRNRAPGILLLALVAMPFRLLIPGQRPALHDFLGALAALVVWSVPALQKRLGTATIALLLTGGLLVEELRPWNFYGHASSFNWVPFISMLDSADWAPTLLVLFRKAAMYGTTVWAVARAGVGIPRASIFTAALLGVLEAAQIFLPGRTAETTDSVLTLMLGMILLLLDRKFGVDPGVGAVLGQSRIQASPQFGEPATFSLRVAKETDPDATTPRSGL